MRSGTACTGCGDRYRSDHDYCHRSRQLWQTCINLCAFVWRRDLRKVYMNSARNQAELSERKQTDKRMDVGTDDREQYSKMFELPTVSFGLIQSMISAARGTVGLIDVSCLSPNVLACSICVSCCNRICAFFCCPASFCNENLPAWLPANQEQIHRSAHARTHTSHTKFRHMRLTIALQAPRR